MLSLLLLFACGSTKDSDQESCSFTVTYYNDADGDGYGDASTAAEGCSPPDGSVADNAVTDGTDCDDTNPARAPGLPETPYDGLDNDCDAATPDDDLDGDGYLSADDCDDTNPGVAPDLSEVYYDGLDNDCDAATPDDDLDGDGYLSADDCDDTNPAAAPDLTETPYDGADNDCDVATPDDDLDGDGVGIATDCNDANSNQAPGFLEVYYDGVDNDCDPTSPDDDLDGDGYGLIDDCDDADPLATPGLPETPYDGADNDCDATTPDDDLDGDGYLLADDCDDTTAEASPDGAEVCGDGLDNDCDGTTDFCSVIQADAMWTGESSFDYAGEMVAGAGDVNADGYTDVLIGAPYRTNAKVYLMLGSATPTSASLSMADVTYTAEELGDEAGYGMDGAGDFNGDGWGDIVIGAHNNDAGGTDSGRVFVVFGGASPTNMDLSGALAWDGEAAQDHAGLAVAGVGDVNADGFADLLVGAPYNSDVATYAGAAYLLLGSADPTGQTLAMADVQFSGERIYDYAGYGVDSVGDINADGFSDLMIGAIQAADAGSVYLVLGAATLADQSLAAADAQYIGEVAGDRIGMGLAGVGDVNGDGYVDMLMGAYDNSDGGLYAGAAYLVLGSALPTGRNLSLADAQYTGEAAADVAGASVSGAGDINADGFADMAIGAQDRGLDDAGAAYLILGQSAPASLDLADADVGFLGDQPDDSVGVSVAGVGDANADGYDDVLIGAYGSDSVGPEAGAAWLVLGLP